jgi:hypothetical protein
VIGLLHGCGLRRSEIVSPRVDQLQKRESHWVIVDWVGKGGRRPDCLFSELNTQPACMFRFAVISDAQDKLGPNSSLLLFSQDSYIPCFMPISLGAPIRR